MQFNISSQFLFNETFLSNFGEALGVISRTQEVAADPGVAAATVTRRSRCRPGRSCSGRSTRSTARPAGLVTIGSVAQVRAGAGGDFVVDFQGMRTVERVHAPTAITQIRPWAGTQFANASTSRTTRARTSNSPRSQTERLLVHFRVARRRRSRGQRLGRGPVAAGRSRAPRQRHARVVQRGAGEADREAGDPSRSSRRST